MENSRLRKAAPTAVNVTVGQRSREYLTDREVERLIEAAKQNRSRHRDEQRRVTDPEGCSSPAPPDIAEGSAGIVTRTVPIVYGLR